MSGERQGGATMQWLAFALAAVSLSISASVVSAHPLRTKKSNRVVPHTHQDEVGHATESNNDPGMDGATTPGKPNGDHKFGFCQFRDSTTPEDGAAKLAKVKARFPAKAKDVKLEAEEFFRAKFPDPPNYSPPGEFWRTKVVQERDTVGARTNCVGQSATGAGGYGDDPGWIDASDANILIDDDYEPNPPGECTCDCTVVYRSHNKLSGPIEHIGEVAECGGIGNAPGAVKSRLAGWGIFTHPVDAVPEKYTENGGGWTVYRKKP